jgi:hypothetical protein
LSGLRRDICLPGSLKKNKICGEQPIEMLSVGPSETCESNNKKSKSIGSYCKGQNLQFTSRHHTKEEPREDQIEKLLQASNCQIHWGVCTETGVVHIAKKKNQKIEQKG